MKIRYLILLAVWSASLSLARADSPASPRPWVVTSKYGNHLFKMVPGKGRWDGAEYITDREPLGVAYTIQDDGELQALWRAEGWYTFEGYLSRDGRYFVRIGPWASDQEEHTDLAIAFYDQGKLVKQYEVRELIKKPDLLEHSVSHYTWRPEIQTDPTGFLGESFHLVMVDKTAYRFDYKTGEIRRQERDAGAKSSWEVWAEEEAEANRKGEQLFEASSIHDSFVDHFEISGIEAMRGNFSSCSLEGKCWTADLTPRIKLPHRSQISMVLPIMENQGLEASITPDDLLQALRAAFEHPFIAQRFDAGGATGIRMRTQGDRLHWNTPELVEYLTEINGAPPAGDKADLAGWAYLLIDAPKPPRYTPVYLHVKTKEIIWVDKSISPKRTMLLDASGKPKSGRTVQ